MVPLYKTSGIGPVGLYEIRPIKVRSHNAKVMEKAILAKKKEEAPDLLAFADDMLMITINKAELEEIVNVLGNLELSHNLRMNKKKSEILSAF